MQHSIRHTQMGLSTRHSFRHHIEESHPAGWPACHTASQQRLPRQNVHRGAALQPHRCAHVREQGLFAPLPTYLAHARHLGNAAGIVGNGAVGIDGQAARG